MRSHDSGSSVPDGPHAPHLTLHLERVSRAALTVNRAVWGLYAGMLAVMAIGAAGVGVLFDAYPQDSVLLCAAAVALAALLAARSEPPALGTLRNHLAITSVYLLIAVAMVAFGPGALIPLPGAMFIGPFVAARVQSHRQIGLHLVAASIALAAPVALGLVDGSAALGVALLIPATWVLGICVMVVLDAAEVQGGELEVLTRRDPLTGVGNRRLLGERLDYELTRHRRSHRQLSVLALDLNGFKALNDSVGHDAGDRLLCDVAAALQATCRAQDTVVRQGGDEFCVLLPETSPAQARAVDLAVRTALAGLSHGGPPVTAGIGLATFPADAGTGDDLLNVADQRLRVDKAGSGRPRTARWRTDPIPAAPAAVVAERTEPLAQVSRSELAVNPWIWWATRLMLAVSTAMTIAFALLAPGNVMLGAVMAAGVIAVTATTFAVAPPRIETVANHVLIASVPIFVAEFVAVHPSAAGAALGAATFIGPFTALRLIDRRQIAAHFAFATLVLGALVPLGVVDQTTALMLSMLIVSTWGLGISCVAVLETAEAEGRQLERLVSRDPLTGAGNRRMLSERLTYEIRRHARTHRPISVLALDLNGFKAINDDLGHAAGDALLREVATALQHAVRSQDTVVRQGGDEFCILLPETGAHDLPSITATVRDRLAGIHAHGHAIHTGIGAATFPADAVSGDALLQIADDRLRAEKAGASSDHLVA